MCYAGLRGSVLFVSSIACLSHCPFLCLFLGFVGCHVGLLGLVCMSFGFSGGCACKKDAPPKVASSCVRLKVVIKVESCCQARS